MLGVSRNTKSMVLLEISKEINLAVTPHCQIDNVDMDTNHGHAFC